MREILLSQGKIAFVDDEDYEAISAKKWSVVKSWNSFYARRYERIDGVQTIVYMHRLLANAVKNQQVDHKDQNTLNNCKDNLRLCSNTENSQNRKKRKTLSPKSEFKGVRPKGGRFIARIKIDGKDCFLASFKSEVEAAKAYDRAAIQYFGEFASLNFPNNLQENLTTQQAV